MKFLGPENIYSDYDKSKVVVIPVPYEKTTSYGKGAIRGPEAILAASAKIEHYDIEEDKVISEAGISTLPPLKNIKNPEELFVNIEKVTRKVLNDKKIPVYLGGEHTVTTAIIHAVKKYAKVDFSVLHMDAHSDMRDTYGGTKYSHACVIRRLIEMGIKTVSVGVRSLSFEERQFIKKEKPEIFYSHDISGGNKWMKEVISRLGSNFYLTFDVDVMDPGYVRATGTPEPDGLQWRQTVDFFKALSKSGRRLIGMDMVELSPFKNDRASDFICAKLIYKILTLFVI